MPLRTSKQLFLDAQKGGYAIGAFNVENMEMVQAVVEAAEELSAPVILQTTPGTIKYGQLKYYAANAMIAARDASVPVVLHLDHGESFDLACQALEEGYTSIMIDGSKLPFDDNIAVTAKTVAQANGYGIPVEAELGMLGGKEDDLHVDAADAAYTNPEDAAVFAARTGISSLAVAIGTAHGLYKGVPKLDLERLCAIRAKTDVPLVLHGGSGLSDEVVRETIRRGICKVNYATELRIAFTSAVKAKIAEKPDAIDPKVFLKEGRAAVKALVKEKILICGCAGK